MPYSLSREIGPDGLPMLLEILGDEQQKHKWSRAVIALGHISDSAAFQPLIDKLEETKGEVDARTFHALFSIPMALGCIASNGDAAVLKYLEEHASPSAWENIEWTHRGIELSTPLALQSVIGLSLAGTDEAISTLNRIKSSVDSDNRISRKEREEFNNKINTGINQVSKIIALGREKYFDEE